MILAGDIGGTKTRLALFAPGPGRSDPVSERTYSSQEYPGLEVIAREFLRAAGAAIESACLGVAGPVKDGRSSTTNLAWVVDARDLARALRLRYLVRRFEPVSWERVLSGPGLVNIYSFLRDSGRGEEPSWLADEISAGEPAAVISAAALSGRSALCSEALDLFVALYGAESGNLALKVMATGGVFIGGGIAPKILARLRGPGLGRAVVAKGRMRPPLEAGPGQAGS